MAGLFSKPSATTLPRVPPPPAIPSVGLEVGDAARRRSGKRSGFTKTILTGALKPDDTGLKTTLG